MLKLLLISIVFTNVLGEAVIELTDSDFESAVGEHDTVLVMFYAPW